MTVDEKRLVRHMALEQGLCPAEIAVNVGRHKSNITRLLAMRKATKQGRPAALTTPQEDRLEKLVIDMVQQADANYEVTLPIVYRRSRLKCSQRTVARALHKRGYRFFRLYEKMILTPQDIRERHTWAKTYASKAHDRCLKTVHIHLDNHPSCQSKINENSVIKLKIEYV